MDVPRLPFIASQHIQTSVFTDTIADVRFMVEDNANVELCRNATFVQEVLALLQTIPESSRLRSVAMQTAPTRVVLPDHGSPTAHNERIISRSLWCEERASSWAALGLAASCTPRKVL